MAGIAVGAVAGLLGGLLVASADLELTLDGGDPAPEALDVIEESYFRKVNPSRLEDASIRGMVQELRRRYDDRFSHYFDPEQLDEFEQATEGRFSGVGLTVSEVKRGLRVSEVIPDTPAQRAGIEEGEMITAVDGRSIRGTSAEVATARIKGPPGTEVGLEILDADGAGRRNLTVRRAEVRIPAIEGRIRDAGGEPVAYVRLATFSEGLHGELREEIERLDERGAEGLVLDLRGNGGGLLNEAVLTSSIFVERGVIVTTRSRSMGRRDYRAAGDALEPRPTVVLIDRDSASASEILTAALAERDLATVVGQTSFGKGSFQEVIELPSGGALDLTVGEYLTSEGRSLADRGIRPMVKAIDDPDTDRDEGLRRALEVIGGELGP